MSTTATTHQHFSLKFLNIFMQLKLINSFVLEFLTKMHRLLATIVKSIHQQYLLQIQKLPGMAAKCYRCANKIYAL